jgi:plasmid stability protein
MDVSVATTRGDPVSYRLLSLPPSGLRCAGTRTSSPWRPCAIIDIDEGEWPVAQLIVRDLDPEIVVELRRRAAESGRSAEAEHRELLRSVLKPGRKRTPLKSLLLGMPAVGEDADFARGQSRARAVRL